MCIIHTQEQEALKKPVQDLLKVLNCKSWTLTKHHPMDTNMIPKKKKFSCLRKPLKRAKSVIIQHTLEESKQYEPMVVDIRKVELKPAALVSVIEFLVQCCNIAIPFNKCHCVCVCVNALDCYRKNGEGSSL